MKEQFLYNTEEKIIREAETVLADETHDQDPLRDIFLRLLDNYRKMFRQLKRLIKFSDKQQDMLFKTVMELEDAKEAAEAANHAKSTFLDNMSHELRTPLNAIIGYSEMLIEESDDREPKEFIPDLQKIHLAGKHLLGLISDILDISKIEAGKMELFLETFNIQQLIRETEDTINPMVEKNNNILHIQCSNDIGDIHADLTKVRQILLNLLSNACKFTTQGRIELNVLRELSKDKEWIAFTISDTGIGMSSEQMEKLFQAFSQVDPSKTRRYGGTGLGLAISKQYGDMMGGELSVQSEPGKGSIFTIRLPAAVTQL